MVHCAKLRTTILIGFILHHRLLDYIVSKSDCKFYLVRSILQIHEDSLTEQKILKDASKLGELGFECSKLFTSNFPFSYCKRNDHIKGLKAYTIHTTVRYICFLCDLKKKKKCNFICAVKMLGYFFLHCCFQNEDTTESQRYLEHINDTMKLQDIAHTRRVPSERTTICHGLGES